ncbi:TPA: hypothetical protein ACPZVG_001456 [Klebsiella pneumoniae]
MTNNQLTEEVLQGIYTVAVSGEIAEKNEEPMSAFDLLCAADTAGGIAHLVRKLIDELRADRAELQERRKAAMGSEPYGFTDGDRRGMIYEPQYADRLNEPLPVYRHAQPAPVMQMVPEEPPEHLLPKGSSRDAAYRRGATIQAWKQCRAAMLQAGNSPVIPEGLPDGMNIYHGPKEKTILVLRQDAPATPDGYVIVPKTLTPKMITRLQLKSEIGGYVAANWAAAYSKFQEFWDIAIAAAPQEVSKDE